MARRTATALATALALAATAALAVPTEEQIARLGGPELTPIGADSLRSPPQCALIFASPGQCSAKVVRIGNRLSTRRLHPLTLSDGIGCPAPRLHPFTHDSLRIRAHLRVPKTRSP
jgi:hypothetical protein